MLSLMLHLEAKIMILTKKQQKALDLGKIMYLIYQENHTIQNDIGGRHGQ